MGVQCLLPDCSHCSDHDKCKYYRIPKDLFEYYKWKHFLESVININEQLFALLKLSQIMLLSFLCQSFFLWCYGVNFVYVISHICTPITKEELSNNQNCQKSIPKPYYKRKQRPRIITSLKGSIGLFCGARRNRFTQKWFCALL